MNARWLVAVPVAVVLLISAAPGSAQDGEPREPLLSSFQIYWENDSFLRADTSDESYTNGTKIAWMYNRSRPDYHEPDWIDPLFAAWCQTHLCNHGQVEFGYGHALGQNLYTPEAIVDPNPQPYDRPWAAYLYYSWIVQATYFKTETQWPVQNIFELQVGIVGPGAGGRYTQSKVHQIIDSPEPQGWSNQIRNEPTIDLVYLWRKKIGDGPVDFVPDLGFSLGNVQTYGQVGGTVRLGYHLSSFPQNVISPRVAPPQEKSPEPFEAFVFVGGEARGVARNIFLDGNSRGDGPAILIDRKGFVSDLKAGFAVRYKGWRIDYTVLRVSSEFDAPRGDKGGPHKFGAVALSWSLWRDQP